MADVDGFEIAQTSPRGLDYISGHDGVIIIVTASDDLPPDVEFVTVGPAGPLDPLELTVYDVNLNYVAIYNDVEWMFARARFAPRYEGSSVETLEDGTLEFTLVRAGGWPLVSMALHVDALDRFGNRG